LIASSLTPWVSGLRSPETASLPREQPRVGRLRSRPTLTRPREVREMAGFGAGHPARGASGLREPAGLASPAGCPEAGAQTLITPLGRPPWAPSSQTSQSGWFPGSPGLLEQKARLRSRAFSGLYITGLRHAGGPGSEARPLGPGSLGRVKDLFPGSEARKPLRTVLNRRPGACIWASPELAQIPARE